MARGNQRNLDAAVSELRPRAINTFEQGQARAGEQYGKQQGALGEYSGYARGQLAPEAAARSRQGFEESIGQARGMIAALPGMPRGYTPAEMQQQRLAATGPIAASFSSGTGEMRNAAARTGNAAGLAPWQARMARERALTLGQVLPQVEGRAADARRSDEQAYTNMQLNAGMNIPGMYGNQQSRETANAGLLQYPAEAYAQSFGQNLQGQLSALNPLQSILATYGPLASQPGFLEKLLQAGSGAASAYLGGRK